MLVCHPSERNGAEDQVLLLLRSDDIVLICTDGLYGEVGQEELIEKLSAGKTMGDTCYDLIDAANTNGGNDNITLICLKITEDDINEQ